MSDRLLRDLFKRSPTRELEEVAKVNDEAQLSTDVDEFHETASARAVLDSLADVVSTHSRVDPRFLYINATFGSGKTHLLKLIGLVVDPDTPHSDLRRQLIGQWQGFDTLADGLNTADADRLKPVFLNLLNRDASKEPPLPFLVYRAIGRELDYPTDPLWLLEWVWQLDMEYDLWGPLQELTHDGRGFTDVLDKRATLRSWLKTAVPTLSETTGTPYETTGGVEDTIESAIDATNPEQFSPSDLQAVVEEVQASLSDGDTECELLLGLDEVALYVGEDRWTYEQFEATIEALIEGPNPPVLTTGQYPLETIHEDLTGEEPTGWRRNEIPLEGADTEIIVRKRWLQKTTDGRTAVSDCLEDCPDLTLQTAGSLELTSPDPVETYPFREYDLVLLRRIMQQLITDGRPTETEYIQGRALLVLVRSLFTVFEWDREPAGRLVSWDVLFDLLVDRTTLVPLWVQELLDGLVTTFGGPDTEPVRVAKAVYLLNLLDAVPATIENLSRVTLSRTDNSLDERAAAVESALDRLVEKRRVFLETTDAGADVYQLIPERFIPVYDKIDERIPRIPPHRVDATVQSLLRESDSLLLAPGSRETKEVGDERNVPLRFEYSIRERIDRAPDASYDSITVRLVAGKAETLETQVEEWQATNADRIGGEHILVTVELSTTLLDKLRENIATADVLSEETGSYPELEADQREERRVIESEVRRRLQEASVYTATGDPTGTFERDITDIISSQVKTEFSDTRYTLKQGLTEVPDAKGLAAFFDGEGDWPLTQGDAVTLGVDPTTGEFTDGWCERFLDDHDAPFVNGDELLEATRVRGGRYRGTSREALAALVLTLATANRVRLESDGEGLTDPEQMGRAVRTKTAFRDVVIYFDSIDTEELEQLRTIAADLTETEPSSRDPVDIVTHVENWVGENRSTIRRLIRKSRQAFGSDSLLEVLESALEPALSGGNLNQAALADEAVARDATQFRRAQELFVEQSTVWDEYSRQLDLFQGTYVDLSNKTAISEFSDQNDIPSVDTIRTAVDEAAEVRQSVLESQYDRLVGEPPESTEPTSIIDELAAWIGDNRLSLQTMFDNIQVQFSEVSVSRLRDACTSVWSEEALTEEEIANRAVRREAETFATARPLFEPREDGHSLWEELLEATERLNQEHPESPTAKKASDLLASGRPPTVTAVRGLLKKAEEPLPPRSVAEKLEELRSLLEDLQNGHADADVTVEVREAVEADTPPTEEEVDTLIRKAESQLEQDSNLWLVESTLDGLDDGSVVVIDTSSDSDQ